MNTFEEIYRAMQDLEDAIEEGKILSVREMMMAERLAKIAVRIAAQIKED